MMPSFLKDLIQTKEQINELIIILYVSKDYF